MPRPEGMPGDEWEEILEKKAEQKARDAQFARIEREGFEGLAFDPEPNDRCVYRTWKKRARNGVWEPCGEKPVVVLSLASPDNPEGMRLPLCRKCLSTHVKDLVTNLEMF